MKSVYNLNRKRLFLPLLLNVSYIKAFHGENWNAYNYFIMENCYTIEMNLVSLSEMYIKGL